MLSWPKTVRVRPSVQSTGFDFLSTGSVENAVSERHSLSTCRVSLVLFLLFVRRVTVGGWFPRELHLAVLILPQLLPALGHLLPNRRSLRPRLSPQATSVGHVCGPRLSPQATSVGHVSLLRPRLWATSLPSGHVSLLRPRLWATSLSPGHVCLLRPRLSSQATFVCHVCLLRLPCRHEYGLEKLGGSLPVQSQSQHCVHNCLQRTQLCSAIVKSLTNPALFSYS